MANNGTTGHEDEAINVQGLKASFQKFKDRMRAELAGPVYDEEDHGFTFPPGAKVSYDAQDHGFVFG